MSCAIGTVCGHAIDAPALGGNLESVPSMGVEVLLSYLDLVASTDTSLDHNGTQDNQPIGSHVFPNSPGGAWFRSSPGSNLQASEKPRQQGPQAVDLHGGDGTG